MQKSLTVKRLQQEAQTPNNKVAKQPETQVKEKIVRKYLAKFGFNDVCKEEIRTYIEVFLENKAKPFKLNRQDFFALDKGVPCLPNVSKQCKELDQSAYNETSLPQPQH